MNPLFTKYKFIVHKHKPIVHKLIELLLLMFYCSSSILSFSSSSSSKENSTSQSPNKKGHIVYKNLIYFSQNVNLLFRKYKLIINKM